MDRLSNEASRRHLLKRIGVLAAGAAAAPFIGGIRSAHAAWPAGQPVRIIVANTPGGPSDLMARFIAPVLTESLGGNFIVENKPGGASNIGMQYVIHAPPDGYTLHLATSAWPINPALYDPPPFDALKDLLPVVELGVSPTVFVVRKELGVNTLKEMVELARKDQSKFNIGIPPVGSALHLGAEYLKYREGLKDVTVIPYQGGGQNIQGVLAGNTQACCSSLAPALPHIKSGTLKALAILGDARWPELPDVPTAADLGYKDFNFETLTALMAPANTPAEIVKRIEQASIAGLAKPEVKARIFQSGFLVTGKTSEQFAARLAHEVPLFRSIAQQANITIK